MTIVHCLPDLSSRPFALKVERLMEASPEVLFKAWTKYFDRWFAAPGSVMMQGEVNTAFSLRPSTKLTSIARRGVIPITDDFLSSNMIVSSS